MCDRKIAKSKYLFDIAPLEYERFYFDHASGGFVLIHEGHNRTKSFKSELFIAKLFAKDGKKVILLNESDTLAGKHPDAEIDSEIWDFKRLTSDAKAFANRVQAGIKEARKQGVTKIAYHIDRDDYDMDEIKRGVGNALDLDILEQIQAVVLILPTGKQLIIQRDNL